MIEVCIDVVAFWHPGTGRGEGPGSDARANRDAVGLPFLPGRTVKGVLREGAQTAADLGQLNPEDVVAVFGTNFRRDASDGPADSERAARHQTHQGIIVVGSACLGATSAEVRGWQALAETKTGGGPDLRPLYRRVASTKIAEDGQAANQTLRTIEVVVPVELCAKVEAKNVPLVLKVLQAAAPYVTAVGAHRTRGLGRCVVTIREVK